MNPGAAFYVWYASVTSNYFENAIKGQLGEIRQTLIWVKNHMILGRSDYQYMHEPCYYGWIPGAAHYFINRRQKSVIGDALDIRKMTKEQLINLITPTSVFYADKPNKSDDHPTMKPIPIIQEMIRNSTVDGGIVADIFAGSGTTLIAAQKLNRVCYAMEIEPIYCDTIVQRFIKKFPQIPVYLNGETQKI